MKTLSRRAFWMGVAGATAALAAACVSAPGSGPLASTGATTDIAAPTTARTTAVAGAGVEAAGALVLVLAGKLTIYDLATRKSRPLPRFPANGFAASPSLSPNRKRIAYTAYVPSTERGDLGGSDLCVVDVDGSSPRVVATHPASGVSYETPAWAPDGSALLATKRVTQADQGKLVGLTLSIVRVPLDGGAPAELLKSATWAAPSADGKRLAYVAVDARGLSSGLWIGGPQGKEARQVSVGPPFALLGAPTFSPDGSRLAFAASGGPAQAGPGQGGSSKSWLSLGAAIAEAHNAYWEVWTVRADGTDLIQLTNLSEDNPVPAWSPRGDRLAIAGEMGLYLVDVAGEQTTRLAATQSSGIAWLS